MPLGVVLAEATQRFPILARRLVDDLIGADRIFVRIADFGVLESGLDRLLTLTRGYGSAPLLFVAKACDGHPAGTVEHVGNGLLRG
jgi:hypothetical protein